MIILKGTLGLQIGKTLVFLLAEREGRFAEKVHFVVSSNTVRSYLRREVRTS